MQHTNLSPALPFQGFFQLAYVTTDLRRAQDVFRDRYDVGEFADLGDLTLALDDGGETNVRIALSFVGALQLEIIEPRGGRDELYRSALSSDGFGLVWHHVGFMVESVAALSEAREQLRSAGHDIVLSGGSPETSMFCYADARATLGHYLEYLYLSPQRREFHDQLPRH